MSDPNVFAGISVPPGVQPYPVDASQIGNVDWKTVNGRPYALVTINGPTDGGDFGPNTAGTTTSGINEAINSMNAQGGGTVVLCPDKTGFFNISASIVMKSGVRLTSIGALFGSTGAESAVIFALANLNADMITSASNALTNCQVDEVSLNGNKANQASGHGIHLFPSSTKLQNLFITGVKQDAIRLSGASGGLNASQVQLAHIRITQCGGDGIHFVNDNSVITDCHLNDFIISTVAGIALHYDVGCGGQRFENGQVFDSAGAPAGMVNGLKIDSCSNVRGDNTEFSNAQHDGVLIATAGGACNNIGLVLCLIRASSQAVTNTDSNLNASGANGGTLILSNCFFDEGLANVAKFDLNIASTFTGKARHCRFNGSGTGAVNSASQTFDAKDCPGNNPVGNLATAFDNTSFLVGKIATSPHAALPTSTANDYLVVGTDILIVDTTPNGGTVTIKDPGGNTVAAGYNSASIPVYVPVGFKLRFVTALPTGFAVSAN